MTTFDFSPMFRSAIGFDRLASVLESAARSESVAYPPYDLVAEGTDRYRLTLAVAGFTETELEIEAKENQLRIAGRQGAPETATPTEDTPVTYLHRGIARRSFERTFQLADHVRVVDARLENGLLHIALAREVPEVMKPRRIEVRAGTANPAVTDTAPDVLAQAA